jgi:hypothetical protein
MLLKAMAGAAKGTQSFTVKAVVDRGQASSVADAVTVLAGGRTALAGRVVDTEETPPGPRVDHPRGHHGFH